MGAYEIRRKEPNKDKTEQVSKLRKKWKKYQVGDEVVQKVSKLSEDLIKKEGLQSIQKELKEIAEKNKLDYPMVIKAFLSFLGKEDRKIAFELFPEAELKLITPKIYFPIQIMQFVIPPIRKCTIFFG